MLPIVLNSACANLEPSPNAELESILANPQKYSGKQVSVCGWLESKIELCVLSRGKDSALGTSGSVWLGAYGDWCDAEKSAVEPFEGWALVSGLVRVGETYGHFGAWDIAMETSHIAPNHPKCGVQPNPVN
jgi:hypothetical protein